MGIVVVSAGSCSDKSGKRIRCLPAIICGPARFFYLCTASLKKYADGLMINPGAYTELGRYPEISVSPGADMTDTRKRSMVGSKPETFFRRKF